MKLQFLLQAAARMASAARVTSSKFWLWLCVCKGGPKAHFLYDERAQKAKVEIACTENSVGVHLYFPDCASEYNSPVCFLARGRSGL